MKKLRLKIEGMTCNHCVMHVKKELEKMTGVNVKEVKIGSAEIEFDENLVSAGDFSLVIEEAGYKLAQ
ncbi:MAG TPA: heavy-metal-associated domain-containing protein [Ignavibacteriaceae bacterium]|nr:heavy-metal-associated domain-containing protein [Ignavibacteriaceae bacterium]